MFSNFLIFKQTEKDLFQIPSFFCFSVKCEGLFLKKHGKMCALSFSVLCVTECLVSRWLMLNWSLSSRRDASSHM